MTGERDYFPRPGSDCCPIPGDENASRLRCTISHVRTLDEMQTQDGSSQSGGLSPAALASAGCRAVSGRVHLVAPGVLSVLAAVIYCFLSCLCARASLISFPLHATPSLFLFMHVNGRIDKMMCVSCLSSMNSIACDGLSDQSKVVSILLLSVLCANVHYPMD